MELRLTPAITLFFSLLLLISPAHSLPLEEEWGGWVKERHHDISCPWGLMKGEPTKSPLGFAYGLAT